MFNKIKKGFRRAGNFLKRNAFAVVAVATTALASANSFATGDAQAGELVSAATTNITELKGYAVTIYLALLGIALLVAVYSLLHRGTRRSGH